MLKSLKTLLPFMFIPRLLCLFAHWQGQATRGREKRSFFLTSPLHRLNKRFVRWIGTAKELFRTEKASPQHACVDSNGESCSTWYCWWRANLTSISYYQSQPRLLRSSAFRETLWNMELSELGRLRLIDKIVMVLLHGPQKILRMGFLMNPKPIISRPCCGKS